MQCLRLLNKNVLDVLDSKTSYKSIGSFKTRREAEEALANYYMNPIDYAGKIETFEQLYEAWAKDYFKKVSPSSVRTVTSTYKYCSAGYNMLIKQMGPGHIKDLMEDAYIIDDKGNKKVASKCTKERIKSMCSLMFDYAYERRWVDFNPARAFKVTHLIREIEEEKRYIEATELLGSDRLFNDPRSQTGIRLTYDKYRRKFEFVMADLALNGFSPHCTRHTFATYAKKSGMEPGITKRIMGHSLRSDVTEYYYTHPEFSDFERELRKLSFE